MLAELDPSLVSRGLNRVRGSHCLGISSAGNSFGGFSLDQSIVVRGVSMKAMKHAGHIYVE